LHEVLDHPPAGSDAFASDSEASDLRILLNAGVQIVISAGFIHYRHKIDVCCERCDRRADLWLA